MGKGIRTWVLLLGCVLACSPPGPGDGGTGGGAGGSGGSGGSGGNGATRGTCELPAAPYVGSNACVEYVGYTAGALAPFRAACLDGGTWTDSATCPRVNTAGACRSTPGPGTATAWYFKSFTVQQQKDLPCNSAVDSAVVLDASGAVVDTDTRDTVAAGCARAITTKDRVTCAVTNSSACTEYLGLWPKLWRNNELTNVCINATTDTGGPCPGSIVEAATWSETGCVRTNFAGGCKRDNHAGLGTGVITIVWRSGTAAEVQAQCADAGAAFVTP